jgi:hypothetical protein
MMPKPYPILRLAKRIMHQDSCGVWPSEEDVDESFIAAQKYCSTQDMERAENFLLYLDEADGLDSPWMIALCGEYENMEALTPMEVGEVLFTLFDGVS